MATIVSRLDRMSDQFEMRFNDLTARIESDHVCIVEAKDPSISDSKQTLSYLNIVSWIIKQLSKIK